MKFLFVLAICCFIAFPAFAKSDKGVNKHKNIPPGLQKKIDQGGTLPPGWQKKMTRGEVIDSELYERAIRIPNKPSKDYPNTKGTELLQIEDRIIRITKDTKEILEILGVKF